MVIEPLEVIIRLVLGFDLAVGVGLERQLGRKPAGFGTFTFVATGTCVLAIMAMELEPDNPLPLLGGAITGVGFLGAGALIRGQDRVFGFTTAALIWAMAAMGLAIGVGLYHIALVMYAILWVVILVDRLLESRGFGSHARVIDVSFSNPIELNYIRSLFPPKSTSYDKIHVDKDNNTVRVRASVRLRPHDADALLLALQGNDKVMSVGVE